MSSSVPEASTYGIASASTSQVSAATGANSTTPATSITAVVACVSSASASRAFQSACTAAEPSTSASAATVNARARPRGGPCRRAPARHHQQVVRTGEEPRREAAPADPDGLRDGLVTAHVDEHAEGLVGERLLGAVAQRRRDVGADGAALADRVLAGRRRRLAGSRRIRHRGGVANRPDVVEALDLAEAVDLDAPAGVERQ